MKTLVEVPETIKNMISKFQCPGCTCGCAPCETCESFKPSHEFGWSCDNHSAGTMISGIGKIFLGMPKGFNRVGANEQLGYIFQMIQLWDQGEKLPIWDYLNIPVWAMEDDGFLFVRHYCPRINQSYIHVIAGGKIDSLPLGIYNVRNFIDDID